MTADLMDLLIRDDTPGTRKALNCSKATGLILRVTRAAPSGALLDV
jgi:hypothetical protein